MNYRHAYHAGNFADVLKHTVLFALIEALQAKATPFCYIDTHAGSGSYALDGFEAGKTGEYKDGISRLHPAEKVPALLQRWRTSILEAPGNANGLKTYPGSPLQVARMLRPGDNAQLCELHSEEAARLRQLFHGNKQVHVHERDGYAALKALLPPAQKRGLVLIDPPYEAQEAEYKLIATALKTALQRWPGGIYALWYPIKLRSQVQPFLHSLQRSPTRRVLRALREPMRALANLLGVDAPARWTLDWLRQEGAEPPEPSPLPPSRLAHLRAAQAVETPHTRRRRDSR